MILLQIFFWRSGDGFRGWSGVDLEVRIENTSTHSKVRKPLADWQIQGGQPSQNPCACSSWC